MRMLPGATGVAEAPGAAASKRVPEAAPCWTLPPLSPAPHPATVAASTAETQTAAAKRSREVKLRLIGISSPLIIIGGKSHYVILLLQIAKK
jgi:hypothetical protein